MDSILLSFYFCFSTFIMIIITIISSRINAEEVYKNYLDQVSKSKQDNTPIESKKIDSISFNVLKYFIIFYLMNTFIYFYIFDLTGTKLLSTHIFTLTISQLLGRHLRLIGVTGQISSGKSYLSNYLRKKGFTVIDIDSLNREILERKEVLIEIRKIFGDEAFDQENKLNKPYLRSVIFTDIKKKKELENITHYRVFRLFLKNVLYYKFIKFESKLFMENAILLKFPLMVKICFPIVSVICNNPSTLALRIMKRDNCKEDEARKILSNQTSVTDFINQSDHIIENNSTLEEFETKINHFLTFL